MRLPAGHMSLRARQSHISIISYIQYGALSVNVYTLYHVRSPKIDLAGFSITGRNDNMVKFPKNGQI